MMWAPAPPGSDPASIAASPGPGPAAMPGMGMDPTVWAQFQDEVYNAQMTGTEIDGSLMMDMMVAAGQTFDWDSMTLVVPKIMSADFDGSTAGNVVHLV